MSKTAYCPLCKGKIEIGKFLAGQLVKCPHCKGQFRMPPMAEAIQPTPQPQNPAQFQVATESHTRPDNLNGKEQLRLLKQIRNYTGILAWLVMIGVAMSLLFSFWVAIRLKAVETLWQ